MLVIMMSLWDVPPLIGLHSDYAKPPKCGGISSLHISSMEELWVPLYMIFGGEGVINNLKDSNSLGLLQIAPFHSDALDPLSPEHV